MRHDLFRLERFLAPADCDRIRRAMDAGTPEDAEVLGTAFEREAAVRRASSIEIAPAAVEEVERRLDATRDAISAFFRLRLDGREGSGFVRYRDGGFYRPHRDRADVPAWPDAARRTVAVVVFLNAGFEGGLLRLFAEGGTIEVRPEEGLLVAFSADVLHDVTIVRGGPRDAIVDWFYSAYAPEAELKMQDSESGDR